MKMNEFHVLAALILLMTLLGFLHILYYDYPREGFFILGGVVSLLVLDVIFRRVEDP